MKKKLVFVLVVLMLVVVAAGAAWFLRPRTAAAAAIPVVRPVLVKVSEVTTNLTDGHYVQARITLKVASHQAAALYKKRQAAVTDQIIASLRSSDSAELKGAAGMTRLGRSIGKAVDGVLGGKDVLHVYFTRLVVQ